MLRRVVAFKTLGCRLNQAEEEDLRRQFMAAGFLVSDISRADLVIINSCSVTNQADGRTKKAVRDVKKANPEVMIVVIGCGTEAVSDMPEVSLVIPNSDKKETLSIITRKFDFLDDPVGQEVPSRRTRALLKIQDGCNNFCAYCIVPYLRGGETSVLGGELITEAKKLMHLGYQELVISGVNVGKYRGGGGEDLADLLSEILTNTSFKRIRLSSVNPQDISPKLIKLWQDNPKLCPHFHLSLQSGSNSVLKRMGRPYTADYYFQLVGKLKKALPEVAITTDVIVGFPGETDQEFSETLDFVRRVGFAKLHVFRYSTRKGTKAAEMAGQIPAGVKRDRARQLIAVGDQLTKEYQKSFIGHAVEVLFEEKKNGYWYGLTPNYIRVRYRSNDDLANKIVKLDLKSGNLIS